MVNHLQRTVLADTNLSSTDLSNTLGMTEKREDTIEILILLKHHKFL